MSALIGNPRILAALLTLVVPLAGTVMARRHRAALARGFMAAEAGTPKSVFLTRRDWEAALLALFVWEMNLLDGEFLLFNVIASWSVARLAAGGLVALAERRAAGLGARGPVRSGWDATMTVLPLAAMLLILASAVRWGG